jgi:hypothetical protein
MPNWHESSTADSLNECHVTPSFSHLYPSSFTFSSSQQQFRTKSTPTPHWLHYTPTRNTSRQTTQKKGKRDTFASSPPHYLHCLQLPFYTATWGLPSLGNNTLMSLCSICQQITSWTLKRISFGGEKVSNSEKCNSHHESFLALQNSGIECELCQLICNALLDNKYTPHKSLQEDAPILLGSVMKSHIDRTLEAPQL